MQRRLSGPARHSDGGEAKREKGGRCLADQSGPQGRIGYGASRRYCWESLSSGGPYDSRRVQPHGPASSGLSRSAERRPSFRNAEPDAFRADRRGKPVRRNTVDRAEGVRPDSIFSLPVGFPFRRLLWAWVESSSLHGKRQPDPCPCRAAEGTAVRRRDVFCCRIEVRQRRRGRSVGNRNLGLRVLSGKNPTALPERTRKRQKAGVRTRRFGSASRTERSLYSVSATTRTIARASVSSS